MTNHTCDRCSQPIKSNRSTLRAIHGFLYVSHTDEIDLCETCAISFTKWLEPKPET